MQNNNEQMTSEDVLAWAKRVKVQRVQASVLNDITETKTFDKIKNASELKNTWGREPNIAAHQRWLCRYCGGGHAPRQSPHMGKCVPHAARWSTLGRCVGAKETSWCMKWK